MSWKKIIKQRDEWQAMEKRPDRLYEDEAFELNLRTSQL